MIDDFNDRTAEPAGFAPAVLKQQETFAQDPAKPKPIKQDGQAHGQAK